MINIGTPYFMSNEEWYEYDLSQFKYVLTPEGKKHEKVVESYKAHYAKKSDEGSEPIDSV